MKGFFGYLLIGAGLGAIVFRIAEIDHVPEWHAWVVFIVIVTGLVFVIEDSKESTIKEIREELEDKMEDLRGEVEEIRE